MDRSSYQFVENYMLSCMTDSAHDREHVYRVLYVALDIAGHESPVDEEVLVIACLLHDIGRREQFSDPGLDHAVVGAEKAAAFLLSHGYSACLAQRVASCIRTHRFRISCPPQSIEAKILFDADKADAAGTLGVARTLLYRGQTHEPLYNLSGTGAVLDGAEDPGSSFFREYRYKLEKLHTRCYTQRGREIILQRQGSAKAFYESMLRETRQSYEPGAAILKELLK